MMPGRLRIRTRIALGSLVVSLVLAVAGGLVLDAQIRHIVRLGTAEVLSSDQRPYAQDIRQGLRSGFDTPGPGALLAVLPPAGAARLDTLPRAVRAELPSILDDDETRAIEAGGRRYLVRAMPIDAADGTWHVVAAREGSSEDAVLGPMRFLLVAVLVLVVLGVTAGAWLLAALSLRPVSRLRTTAARIAVGPGDETLPVGRTDDEISRLATTLNALIGRLRAATERERRLVSDASHELRTPVAVVRTQLELARAGSGDADALRRDIVEAEAGILRLSRLLDALLELSAIQAAPRGSTTGIADVVDEVEDAVERAVFRTADGAGGRSVTVDYAVEDTLRDAPGVVAVSPEDVGRIVDNLLSNSLAALDGRPGRIVVSAGASPGTDSDVEPGSDAARLRLVVEDDAGGLPPGLGTAATERFTRGPDARRGTGSGLGLAIVSALVETGGGTLRLLDRPGEGLTVMVELPIDTATAVTNG